MEALSVATNAIALVDLSIRVVRSALELSDKTTEMGLAALVDELSRSLDVLQEAKVTTELDFVNIVTEANDVATDLLEMDQKLWKSSHAPLWTWPVYRVRLARSKKQIQVKMKRLLALQNKIQTTM